MNDNKINTPFTDEQVNGLRRWQKCGWVHEFTCCDHATMEVSRHGFLCPKCGNLQDWAWDYMADGPPAPTPFWDGPVGNWSDLDGYQEIKGKNCTITLEPRPGYCDRGNWIAKVFEDDRMVLSMDNQDGWPRYFMDEQRAKLEIEAWLTKRGQAV